MLLLFRPLSSFLSYVALSWFFRFCVTRLALSSVYYIFFSFLLFFLSFFPFFFLFLALDLTFDLVSLLEPFYAA